MARQPPERDIVHAQALASVGKWRATLDCGHKVVLDNRLDPAVRTKTTTCNECLRQEQTA